MTVQQVLSKLPAGFRTEEHEGDTVYRIDCETGEFVRVMRKTDGKRVIWLAVNYNPDATASHANWYPSFKQLLAAV